MKFIPLFILIFSFTEAIPSEPEDPVRKQIYLDYIQIEGKTNLNEFKLIFGDDISFHSSVASTGFHKKTGDYIIPLAVRDFEAENKLIYNDFLNLLKAYKFPYIYISIPKEQIEELEDNKDPELFFVNINLAGKTKNFLIREYDKSGSRENVAMKGILKIRLSDFNLTPPEKGFGLIKVNDLVVINFSLNYLPL